MPERKLNLPLSIPREGLFIALAAICVAWYVTSTGGGFPLDDSWIHQVYGRNLAQTGQWAFIPGVPSAASTSPLYTVLLAVGYALKIPYALWTHLIGAIGLAFTGIFAAWLADQYLPNSDRFIIGGAVILTWQLIWAGASGMETPVFCALTLAVMVCAWRELIPRNFVLPALATRAAVRRGVVFGVVGALCTLARPEGVLLAGLAGIAVLLARPNRLVAWIIGAGLGFGVMIAPYLLLNLQLTGGLLPNTAAAKFVQHLPLLAQSYTTRLLQMTLPLIVGGQLLLIPGVFMYVFHSGHRSREIGLRLLPILWIVGLIALYAARLPASYQYGRYVLPALPSLVLTGVVGTILLVRAARASRWGRILTRSLVITLVLLMVYFAVLLGRETYRRDVTIINQEMVAAADWIRTNLPPEDLLAIHDIGAVGYFAPRPMIDIAGLLSPEVVPIINDADGLWAYMQAQGALYLMAFPDQIPGDDPDDPRLCLVYTTNGTESRRAGGPNMAVYHLAWDEQC